MAAPACDKCFATIPPGALTCPECGAPVGSASVSESDADVYPDLARANLARMRGDYKAAEDQLLSVLKRYPNNPSANEMLGDLAMEREDWPHALQWYEMTLEIVPDSASVARKLQSARARITRKEEADTTSQLGLPDPSSRMPWLVGGFVALLVLIAAGAYWLGSRTPAVRPPPNLVRAEPDGGQPLQQMPPGGNPAPAAAGEDQAILDTLRGKCADAGALVGAAHDPRAGTLTISFNLSGKEDRALAARIARDALAALPGYETLTLRGLSGGKTSYMADAARARLAETEAPGWKEAHPEPEAWVAHLLRNEWPAGAGPAEGAGASPPGAEPTGGTTSGPGSTGSGSPGPGSGSGAGSGAGSGPGSGPGSGDAGGGAPGTGG